jgi:hypothetical protein
MAILLDTNILLRQAEPRHAQHQVSAEATDELRRRGDDLTFNSVDFARYPHITALTPGKVLSQVHRQ